MKMGCVQKHLSHVQTLVPESVLKNMNNKPKNESLQIDDFSSCVKSVFSVKGKTVRAKFPLPLGLNPSLDVFCTNAMGLY